MAETGKKFEFIDPRDPVIAGLVGRVFELHRQESEKYNEVEKTIETHADEIVKRLTETLQVLAVDRPKAQIVYFCEVSIPRADLTFSVEHSVNQKMTKAGFENRSTTVGSDIVLRFVSTRAVTGAKLSTYTVNTVVGGFH